MIAINSTSPLQHQSDRKGEKNGASMSIAVTKVGYGSDALMLEDGCCSRKLFCGKSEVSHL